MKHTLLLKAACVFLFCSFAPELPGQSQAQLNVEAGERLSRADAKLNEAYRALLKEHEGDQQFLSDLKEAQRAWLRFTEYHLKTVFPLKKGENAREVYGSAHSMEVAEEQVQLIQQRTKQLRQLLGQ